MKNPRLFRYIARYFGGMLLFAAGALSCNRGANAVSMVLFSVLGVLESVLIFDEVRKLLDLRILMTVSWCFGIGLAALKLTLHAEAFGVGTWFVLGGFYFAFLLAYDLLWFLTDRRNKATEEHSRLTPVNGTEEELCRRKNRVFWSVVLIALLAVGAFLLEAVKFRFQFPILVSGKPHAYTEFHMSGVHYFVVTGIFVPAVTVYGLFLGRPKTWQIPVLVLANALALLIPVLLLSKLYLVLFFVFPFLVFLMLQKRFKRGTLILIVLGIAVVSAAVFALFVSRRQYPAGYLESVFRFRDPSVPVALQYPYVYVTNNFENLNLLVLSGDPKTFGLRELFPFFALTGLKFHPAVAGLLQFPVHNTVEELTTVTMVYDAFGDFGSAGVAVFGMLLGVLSFVLTRRLQKEKSLATVLLYMQVAVYFALAFFSTWFSNPTTWFWFAVTAAIGWFTGSPRKFRQGVQKEEQHGKA